MAEMFNKTQFQGVLDHDNFATRDAIRAISADPVFCQRYNVSVQYQQEVALEQMRKLTKLGNVSVQDFGSNPSNIFSAHEVGDWYN